MILRCVGWNKQPRFSKWPSFFIKCTYNRMHLYIKLGCGLLPLSAMLHNIEIEFSNAFFLHRRLSVSRLKRTETRVYSPPSAIPLLHMYIRTHSILPNMERNANKTNAAPHSRKWKKYNNMAKFDRTKVQR